jgi:outer membrane protein
MKKLLAVCAIVLGSLSATAQKTGYINSEEMIGIMPETEKASKELQEYQELLAQQYRELYSDLAVKDSLFKADSAKWTATKRQVVKDEMTKMFQDLQVMEQTAEQKIQAKRDEKLVPIRAKLLETIKTVAKENGYTYILESGAVIVGPPGDEVSGLVKKKLGIKDPAPAPGAAPKAPAKTGN